MILLIRGERVIIDSDLAKLYGVPTKRLNEQVKRNNQRFPADFQFQVTKEEKAKVVANCDHLRDLKFSPVLPFAFTEHGAIMAASVLNSKEAVRMSIFVVRAFVKIREILHANTDLSKRLEALEKKLSSHDDAIIALFAAIKDLIEEPSHARRPIGFRPKE